MQSSLTAAQVTIAVTGLCHRPLTVDNFSGITLSTDQANRFRVMIMILTGAQTYVHKAKAAAISNMSQVLCANSATSSPKTGVKPRPTSVEGMYASAPRNGAPTTLCSLLSRRIINSPENSTAPGIANHCD